MYEIRKIHSNEVMEALALALEVFLQFEAPDYKPEGIETFKRDIVENDEFDTGERMFLNFGHTLGHAIESYYNYEKYTHGSAVAIGMCMITEKASDAAILKRLQNCVLAYNLPVNTEAPIHELLKLCSNDKKRESENINYIVCSKIGKAAIKKVNVAEFEHLMEN